MISVGALSAVAGLGGYGSPEYQALFVSFGMDSLLVGAFILISAPFPKKRRF